MLSMPRPRTRTLPPAALRSSRHGCRSAASMTSSSSSPRCLTWSCGTAAAALARPSVKLPLLSCKSPEIVPPRPSERIERAGHPRGEIVAVEQQRLPSVEGQVERGNAAGEVDGAGASIAPPPAVVPASR